MKRVIALVVLIISFSAAFSIDLTLEKVNKISYLTFRLDSNELKGKNSTVDYVVILEILDSDKKIVFFDRKNILYLEDDIPEGSSIILRFNASLDKGDYVAYLKIKSRKRSDKLEEKFKVSIGDERKATDILILRQEGDMYIEANEISPTVINEFYLDQRLSQKPGAITLVCENENKTTTSSIKPDTVLFLSLKSLNLLKDLTKLHIEIEFDGDLYHYPLRKIEQLHEFQKKYSWSDQLKQMKYIVNQTELRKINKDNSLSKQERVLLFWKRNGGEDSSLQRIFYNRILEVDRKFSVNRFKRGWETDRGRIYIKFGEPDEVEVNNYPIGKSPTQTWTYYAKQKTFYFYDRSRTEDYKLYNKEEEYDY